MAAYPELAALKTTATKRDGTVRTVDAPEVITKRMAAQGLIVVQPCLGGVTLYLPQDAPARNVKDGSALAAGVFASMGK
jgi:hypothetical protein